ncbi:MAG: c-type cytochrome [Betaproteobacteria bacterium]
MSRCSEVARSGTRRPRTAIVVVVAFAGALTAVAAPLQFGFGKPATPREIAGWDIDVRPDGKGLPPGRGTVMQGQAIYDEKCTSCHGTFGESNSYLQIAGGVGSLGTDQPVRTVGSKLNYATTLWDYINRAMPFNAPQSLTADEVYALTAYVLNLNDILPADATLDQQSLPQVKMPNRNGFTTAHGFMQRNGKPDTSNTACMTNCVTTVKLSSELPEYARDQHGNLAEQAAGVGVSTRVSAGASASPKSGSALAQANACTTCHDVAERKIGPGWREVATKYRGDSGAEARLLAKVKAGGVGVWGNIPMPPQAHLKDGDGKALIQWILGGARP